MLVEHTSEITARGANHAVIVGAGLGGLASAMRLGAKGWQVTVVDRLESAGGRGSSITKDGHRFDLGPTIVTVPQVFEDLWAACGLDFHKDVDLRPLDPFYEIRWPDGSVFAARKKTEDMLAEVRRLSPGDEKGYLRFLKDAHRRYVLGFEGMVAKPMHRAWETIKVLPEFALLRADRSILGLARARVKDERLRMALSFHPLFIGGDPFHVTSMYILVSHLEKEFGVHYAMGGVQAIADAMAKIVTGQGGQVLHPVAPRRDRQCLTVGVALEKGDNVVHVAEGVAAVEGGHGGGGLAGGGEAVGLDAGEKGFDGDGVVGAVDGGGEGAGLGNGVGAVVVAEAFPGGFAFVRGEDWVEAVGVGRA